jgi:hypothetical protein
MCVLKANSNRMAIDVQVHLMHVYFYSSVYGVRAIFRHCSSWFTSALDQFRHSPLFELAFLVPRPARGPFLNWPAPPPALCHRWRHRGAGFPAPPPDQPPPFLAE